MDEQTAPLRGRGWTGVLLRAAGLRLCVLPLTALCVLATTGYTIHYAGAAAFGFITMIAQLQLAVPFADLGLGAAVARAVARSEEDADRRAEAEVLLARTARLLAAVGLTGAAGAVMLGLGGVWSELLEVPQAAARHLDVAVTLVLVLFLLSLPLGIAERVLVGTDRAGLLIVLGAIPAAGNLGYVLVAGALGVPPAWLVMGLPLGTLAFLLACAWAAWGSPRTRFCPVSVLWSSGRPRPGGPRRSAQGLLRAGVPVLLATAGLVLAEQHGRLVLNQIADPETVSRYALALQLHMPVHSVLYMAATVLWPRFASRPERGLWIRSNGMLVLMGCCAAAGYAALAAPVAEFVSGGEISLPWPLVAGFAGLLLAQSAHLAQMNLLTDRQGFRQQALMNLCLLGSVVPLTVLLHARLESLGPGTGLGSAAPALGLTVAVLAAQVLPGLLLASRRFSGCPSASPSTPERSMT